MSLRFGVDSPLQNVLGKEGKVKKCQTIVDTGHHYWKPSMVLKRIFTQLRNIALPVATLTFASHALVSRKSNFLTLDFGRRSGMHAQCAGGMMRQIK